MFIYHFLWNLITIKSQLQVLFLWPISRRLHTDRYNCVADINFDSVPKCVLSIPKMNQRKLSTHPSTQVFYQIFWEGERLVLKALCNLLTLVTVYNSEAFFFYLQYNCYYHICHLCDVLYFKFAHIAGCLYSALLYIHTQLWCILLVINFCQVKSIP